MRKLLRGCPEFNAANSLQVRKER